LIKKLCCAGQSPRTRLDNLILIIDYYLPLLSIWKKYITGKQSEDIMMAAKMTRISLLAGAAIALSLPAKAAPDYPTSALAEYVYSCMKANGENRDMLDRCSCSIDVIASVITYPQYEAAETYKQMGLLPGENGVLFRDSAPAKASITELKRAQAEADVRCF
jgi:hypothetical protein